MAVLAVQRDELTADFFDGTARGELLIRRCHDCGHHNPPAGLACSRCRSARLEWTPALGTGSVVSWTVVHDKATGARTVAAIVELDEGPWLHAQLTSVDPDAVEAGLRVRVGFERPEAGEAIPTFRP
jgi:uncharacterized OB-fold protein